MTDPRPTRPLRLHYHPLSGHSHRAQLMLSLLELPHELVHVDLAARAHKAPAFLALNVFGQVPVLEDGDTVLADSNAILVYLASRWGAPTWLPREPLQAAAVQRWLSIAAGPLAYAPAAARRANVFGGGPPAPELIERSHALLAAMNHVLSAQAFLATSSPSIADLANYTYVAHAPEGGVSLDEYAHVRAWLGRIEALPHFVPMVTTRVGLRA